MICILVAGALISSQASHFVADDPSKLPPLEFSEATESGHREFLKQVHRRTAYINKHNIKLNPWDRHVKVRINGGIGLIVPDGVFVREGDLLCDGKYQQM